MLQIYFTFDRIKFGYDFGLEITLINATVRDIIICPPNCVINKNIKLLINKTFYNNYIYKILIYDNENGWCEFNLNISKYIPIFS